jgi:hypothetical protein
LPLKSGFHRWTATQQRTFAGSLSELIDDPDQDAGHVMNAVAALAALPSVSHARVVELAGTGNDNPAVQVAALTALGQLDSSAEGVPVLLEAVGDSRAHFAIHALRSALLDMPLGQALSILRGIPIGGAPVAVAKEVVRLLGDIRAEGAFADLLALDPLDLHRDVRLALMRALWNYLDREETWQILERAAISEDEALAIMAGRTSADRLSRGAQRRLLSLLALVLQHPNGQVRVQVLDRCAHLPVADTEGVLLPRIVVALSSPLPQEVEAAAPALFAVATPQGVDSLGRAVEGLLTNPRSLQVVVQELSRRLSWDLHLTPVALRVLEVLAADALTSGLQVELAVEALGPEELSSFLARLASGGGLHADALGVAAQKLEGSVRYAEPEDLQRLEANLGTSEHEHLRRLGLAALVAAAGNQGWTEDKVERLNAYRADVSLLVASAARFTFPVSE